MTRRGRVVVLGASCLVSATLALVQFRPSPRQESPAPNDQPQLTAIEQPVAQMPASRPVVRKTAVNARPVRSTATTLPVPVKSDVTTVVTAKAPRNERGDAPVAEQRVAQRDEQASLAPSMITISGCLEQDDERFQLKDASGQEAPKGRSWKSGFLRRSASTIDVIDQADRLHLPTYVGQRVSVTGTLVDREMQVRSVAIVSESCQEKSA